jgi:hypothetical protein
MADKKQQDARAARLTEALRANLRKRREQARQRNSDLEVSPGESPARLSEDAVNSPQSRSKRVDEPR